MPVLPDKNSALWMNVCRAMTREINVRKSRSLDEPVLGWAGEFICVNLCKHRVQIMHAIYNYSSPNSRQ